MKKFSLIFLCIFIITSLSSCVKIEKYTTENYMFFDTFTQITAYCKSGEEFVQIKDIVFSELDRYHKLFDIYNNYENINNLKTINDNAGITPIETEKEIIELLEFSIENYSYTNGKVNIAFGSVLSAWHTCRELAFSEQKNAKIPEISKLKELAKDTDISKIIIDKERNTVFLQDEKMSLDVGAVAKGFAVEKVAQNLSNQGFSNVLISVGGNVKAIGKKSQKKDDYWNVGIQNPIGDGVLAVAKIADLSLVTSGDYQRFFTVDNEKYHHIIDTNTLFPSKFCKSVTVISQNSATADLLSTALFNMSLEDGKNVLKSYEKADAFWVLSDNSVHYSDDFNEYLK